MFLVFTHPWLCNKNMFFTSGCLGRKNVDSLLQPLYSHCSAIVWPVIYLLCIIFSSRIKGIASWLSYIKYSDKRRQSGLALSTSNEQH
jgi:hypothetical protein